MAVKLVCVTVINEAFNSAKSLATNIHYPFDVINQLFAVSVKTSRCRTVENTRCFDTLRFQRRQTTCKDCLTCIAIMINLPASQSPLTHYCHQLYLETYRDKIPLFYLPSVLWRCWLGGRKGIRPVKNRVVGYWRGYLSEARCRLAYGPADATHCLLLQ